MKSSITDDTSTIKEQFSDDKRVHVRDVLPDEVAQNICVEMNKIEYEIAYTSNGQPGTVSRQQFMNNTPEQQQKIMNGVYQDANKGVGFLYERKQIKDAPSDKVAIARAFAWLNSPDTLNAIKEVSGFDDIVSASAQLTRYVPGHFLTRHNDLHNSEQRRVAYVLNLTPKWHPDWGGLLQFYQNNGTPRDAWAPTFNAMALFDVNHVHAVTHVAPFASAPRLAISGWFRATEL